MDFDADKTVSYWLEGAAYDLGVAEAMLRAENTLMPCLWAILR